MKFDCGETWEEEKARKSEWHTIFLWFPRKLKDHDCRWLETIQRRGEWLYEGQGDWSWCWEYRANQS